MGYYISMWEGPQPVNAEVARQLWNDMYELAHPRVAPNARMQELLARLRAEWPEDMSDGSPWKYLPLEREAAGPLFDTVITWGSAATAAPRLAAIARELGLVFYDPQDSRFRVTPREPWE